MIKKIFGEVMLVICPLLFLSTPYFVHAVYTALIIAAIINITHKIVVQALLHDVAKMHFILKDLHDAGLLSKDRSGTSDSGDT